MKCGFQQPITFHLRPKLRGGEGLRAYAGKGRGFRGVGFHKVRGVEWVLKGCQLGLRN